LYPGSLGAHLYACMAIGVLKSRPSIQMAENMIEPVVRRFRALGEPQRLRILQVLESGEKTVNEVVDAIGTSQPTISRHLQALFDAGLVSRRRSGTSTVYFISDPLVFKLCDLTCRSVVEQARAGLKQLASAARKPGAKPERR
jgi:DNA-binding transcriptional ArsR family regulator